MSKVISKVRLTEPAQHIADFSEDDFGAIAYIQIDPAKHRVVGTDGRVMVIASLQSADFDEDPVLVHAKTLGNAIRSQR